VDSTSQISQQLSSKQHDRQREKERERERERAHNRGNVKKSRADFSFLLLFLMQMPKGQQLLPAWSCMKFNMF
jgi:hypothetical protein